MYILWMRHAQILANLNLKYENKITHIQKLDQIEKGKIMVIQFFQNL